MNKTFVPSAIGSSSLPAAPLAALALAALILLTPSASLADDLVPLNLNLPAPAFVGTPKDAPERPNIEPLSGKPRPPLMVPPGLKNLAPGSKITCSDTNASPEVLAKIVDGSKESVDTGLVSLRKGPQYVQFDLGATDELFAIVIWHSFDTLKDPIMP